jgi:hypothetical protein
MFTTSFSNISPLSLILSIGFIFGAIIQYSALVNRIKGRVSHSVLSNWKGRGIIKRHNSHPRQAQSVAQQEIRGLMNDLAGEYYALTDDEKGLWEAYVALLPNKITPLNAYISHNQVIQKYFPGTARLETPPTTPETPLAAGGVSSVAMPAGEFCIYWTRPLTADQTIVCDFAVAPGRRTDANPKWKFGASCGADETELLLQTYMPAGYHIYYRLRTVSIDGKTSPWSATKVQTSLAAE